MGIAPMDLALSSLSLCMSTGKILDAPRSLALYAAISPTGPAPKIAIVSPGLKPQRVTPSHPVGNMSVASKAKQNLSHENHRQEALVH